TAPIPTITPSKTTPIRQYTQRARIAQSSALPPAADEPASPLRDVSQGEACITDSGFIADQDMATITNETKEVRLDEGEVAAEGTKSETLKKQKFQKQIDAQIAKELKEQLEREDQRRSEQIAKDEEITRIHAEEELQIMIDGLD
nr:hypothetical protein [Tanacetum cinerariifolium]